MVLDYQVLNTAVLTRFLIVVLNNTVCTVFCTHGPSKHCFQNCNTFFRINPSNKHCNLQCLAPWHMPSPTPPSFLAQRPAQILLPEPWNHDFYWFLVEVHCVFSTFFHYPFWRKNAYPTQLKDFDALLLLPLFESRKMQKRLEMQFFRSNAKTTVKIKVGGGDAPGVAS